MTATPPQSFIGDTWGLPTSSPTTSTAGLFSGMKMTQSTLSDDTAKTHSGSQNDWASGINSNSNNIPVATKTQSNMGWSSDISQPHSGMIIEPMQPSKTHSGTTSMGMELIQPQTYSDSSAGWSSDISKTIQHHSGTRMEIMQPNRTHSGSLTGWSSDINKTTQPLSGTTSMGITQPLQTHSGSLNMGWSSQPQTDTSMGIMQPQSTISMKPTTSSQTMGWSSDISKPIPHSDNMGMGFLQPQNQSIGMGIMQPQIQPHSGVNSALLQPQNQSIGGGMGIMQPQIQPHSGADSAFLQPQNQSIGGGMGIMQPQIQPHSGANSAFLQPQIQTSMGTGWSSGPAPGPNPFADFNSLL